MKPDTRSKMSAKRRARWADPAGRERYVKALRTPQARQRMSIAAKRKWQDPGYRERILRSLHSPAVRAKAAASNRTPEKRALISKAVKASWVFRKAQAARA